MFDYFLVECGGCFIDCQVGIGNDLVVVFDYLVVVCVVWMLQVCSEVGVFMCVEIVGYIVVEDVQVGVCVGGVVGVGDVYCGVMVSVLLVCLMLFVYVVFVRLCVGCVLLSVGILLVVCW